MGKKVNIALLITLIAVLLTLWNTVLTLHVCARLDGAAWRVKHIEEGFSKVMNTLQIETEGGRRAWERP